VSVAGGGRGGNQPFDVGCDDPGDACFDLFAGFVVAAAEPVFDALELLFGFGERPLAGGGGFAVLF
jgi:hypothetical protein